jgi:uncharacterized protein YjbI with pentapeptide repeats
MPISYRETVADSWKLLLQRGYAPPYAGEIAYIPPRMPRYDDPEPLGLSFFRTRVMHQNFSGLSMPRTFFGRSELEAVAFDRTDLSESCMTWCNWVSCSFVESVLRGADLRSSRFAYCDFRGADLSLADLRRSTLIDCAFDSALMNNLRLCRKQRKYLQLSGSQLSGILWRWFPGELPPGG